MMMMMTGDDEKKKQGIKRNILFMKFFYLFKIFNLSN